jgi:hypothetical protein
MKLHCAKIKILFLTNMVKRDVINWTFYFVVHVQNFQQKRFRKILVILSPINTRKRKAFKELEA